MQSTLRKVLLCFALVLLVLLALGQAPAGAPIPVGADAATSCGPSDTTAEVPALPREAAPTTLYTAPVGTRVTYALEVEIAVTVTGSGDSTTAATPAGPAGLKITVLGTACTTLLGRSGNVLWLDQDWSALRLTAPAATDPATVDHVADLQACLRQGCEQRLDAEGRLLAMRGHGRWSSEHLHFARALAQLLSCEGRPSGTWAGEHGDHAGRHLFEHTTRPSDEPAIVQVVRRRVAFVPAGIGESVVENASGTTLANFSATIGWLQELTIEDGFAWRVAGGALRIAAASRGWMRCIATAHVPVPTTWAGDFAEDRGAAAKPAIGDPMQAAWEARLGNASPAELAALLQGEIAEGRVGGPRHAELLQLLAALVRRTPLAADELVELVRTGRAGGQFAADLLAALGMAGNGRAQAGLADLLGDGRVPVELRQASLEAMIQLADPRAQLVTAVRDLLQSAAPQDPLASSAMLALGAFAGRGAPQSHGPSMLDTLLAAEGRSRRDGLGRAWCEALGNTGDPAVLPVAERLLRSTDAAERIGGLTAMRRVDSPTVAELVATVARTDVDSEVRREALQIAAERDGPWATSLLLERASAEGDPEVRRFAYAGLGWRARTDSSCREFLVIRSQQEPVAELRAQLQSLLVGS